MLGDLIINILVYVPEKLTSDERKAIEKLSNSANCTPNESNRQSMFSRLKYFFTKHE